MNEADLKALWEVEKPIYAAWGGYVVERIIADMGDVGIDSNVVLKIKPVPRLKDANSLVDKALYRGKSYEDPYNEIEDKVGARFVVLLLKEIDQICEIINNCTNWRMDPCRHFAAEQKEEPLLFTYQSVHYILRPKDAIEYQGIKIPGTTTCEIQIRTLLQHAHAELTHDAIYKAKNNIRPEIHRTVAKTMALIETTDGFFKEVVEKLSSGPLDELGIMPRLDSIYQLLTGLDSHTQKSALIIWEVYEAFIDDQLVGNIQQYIDRTPALADIIRTRYPENVLYQQSTVLFLCWMLKKRKNRLLDLWPLSMDLLQPLAADIGVAINE